MVKKNWDCLNSTPWGAFSRETLYNRASSKMAISPGPHSTAGLSMQYESIPQWVKNPPSPETRNDPLLGENRD